MTTDLNSFQKECHNKISVLAQTSINSEPIYDGIYDIDGYTNSPLKIMWILKEAYSIDENGNNTHNGGWAIYDCWEDDAVNVIKQNKTWSVMAQILYGITTGCQYNEMPPINDEMVKLLKASAYINVNKMPGETTTQKVLKNEYKIWKEILFEQINGYNPDVIIFGNTYNLFESDFEKENSPLKSVRVDNSYESIAPIYKTTNGKFLIDTFHPIQTQYKRAKFINSIINNIRNSINL